jgi:hypothetical protein
MPSSPNGGIEEAHPVEAAAGETVSLEGVEMTELNPTPGSSSEATRGEGEPLREETAKEKHKRQNLENVMPLPPPSLLPPPLFSLVLSVRLLLLLPVFPS